jgi:hypothetical protein
MKLFLRRYKLMGKYKFGDKLKSTFTGLGIQYGKVYDVVSTKYPLPRCVVIRNDEGIVGYYDEDYFVLV